MNPHHPHHRSSVLPQIGEIGSSTYRIATSNNNIQFARSSSPGLTILPAALLTKSNRQHPITIFFSHSFDINQSNKTTSSIIMKLVEEIQDNAITKLRFTCEDDDAIDNIHQIISAVKKNSSILTVEMVDDFLGCVRNDARSELLQALGSIPCLQEIRLEQGLLLVGDLAEILCDCTGLKVLIVKNIVLQGIEDDFQAMEIALYAHPSIKEFSLEGCRAAIEDISIAGLQLAGNKQVCAHGGMPPAAQHNPASARSA